tara:strand:+ start:853 stop:1086 length:234 start_codon:yes stop_codon:yes gene_type:complete
MGFWSDQFRESRRGKFSSKKLWGFIIMSLVCISYIVAGFAWYTIDVSLFNSMLISGTTLLGLRIIGGLFSKKKDADK